MLQRLPEVYQNGKIIGYDIFLQTFNSSAFETSVQTVSAGETFSTCIELYCAMEYNVSIEARTGNGSSPTDSSVVVPTFTEGEYTHYGCRYTLYTHTSLGDYSQ